MRILYTCPRCVSVMGVNQLWCEGCGFQLDIEGYKSWEEAEKKDKDDGYDWDDDF
ncbi:hypothetical protein [Methanobrevibacter sp.]|uniref:hypothetical protein n=1 Tax=Methanobrevibacter sp. TaxID=66852 RepID=UPI00388D8114